MPSVHPRERTVHRLSQKPLTAVIGMRAYRMYAGEQLFTAGDRRGYLHHAYVRSHPPFAHSTNGSERSHQSAPQRVCALRRGREARPDVAKKLERAEPDERIFWIRHLRGSTRC